MSLKITLDPGHGKTGNKSPNNPAYVEGTQMFKLAYILKEELEALGAEVLVTRKLITDDPTLAERGSTAGNNGCDMFLSLHSNAPGQSTDANGNKYYDQKCTGTVVYYSMTRAENLVLADLLGKKVSELMGHYYRGSKTREYPNKPGVDYYGVIRGAAQSGCSCAMLIEHGFHTNISDSNYLLNEDNLRTLAKAEAGIIVAYFADKKEAPAYSGEIKAGDLVSVKSGATYWSGKAVPSWVSDIRWYVVQINASTGRAVINKSEDGKHEIMSPISSEYLVSETQKAEEPANEETPPAEEKTVENTFSPDEELTLPVTFKKYGSILAVDFDRDKLAEFIK